MGEETRPRKIREQTCYWCDEEPGVTADHVPPKGIFPKSARSDVPHARACTTCNGLWTSDSELLRDALVEGVFGQITNPIFDDVRAASARAAEDRKLQGNAPVLLKREGSKSEGPLCDDQRKRLGEIICRVSSVLHKKHYPAATKFSGKETSWLVGEKFRARALELLSGPRGYKAAGGLMRYVFRAGPFGNDYELLYSLYDEVFFWVTSKPGFHSTLFQCELPIGGSYIEAWFDTKGMKRTAENA